MPPDINSLPTRKTSAGTKIETRPLYVEEWLDKLPYIDFQKTGQLLYEAIKATNKEVLKPAVRLELVHLYHRPYQYYIDSQIKTGAQHTLQSISSMQAQLEILKKIAVNLGLACKLSVDELMHRKTLWGNSKPPLAELLMSLNYLSHAMIFSFLEYAPIPKNVWQEVNAIYGFAQDIGRENNTILLPGKEAKTGATSIAHAYKKIILASLADPHHLPFGAIWEIFEQLQAWAEHAQIVPFTTPAGASGYFVINLEKDAPPIPYSKFNTRLAGEKHRLIDTTALGKIIGQQLEKIKKGKKPDSSVRISSNIAGSIMTHMSKAWGLPPKRDFPRESCQGAVKITCGLNSTFFFVNKEEDFVPPQSSQLDSDDLSDYLDYSDSTLQRNYAVDEWSLVDEGAGGFAVVKNDRPRESVRVGDLVGILGGKPGAPADKWTLGVIRWLMIRQNTIYKVGIQIIGKDAFPAAIRARDGNHHERQFRRALLLVDPTNKANKTVITNKGMFTDNREMELTYNNQSFQVKADSLRDSTTSFEHFAIKAAARA